MLAQGLPARVSYVRLSRAAEVVRVQEQVAVGIHEAAAPVRTIRAHQDEAGEAFAKADPLRVDARVLVERAGGKHARDEVAAGALLTQACECARVQQRAVRFGVPVARADRGEVLVQWIACSD